MVVTMTMMIRLQVLIFNETPEDSGCQSVPRTVAAKVCPADPKGSRTSSQNIHGYISVTDTL